MPLWEYTLLGFTGLFSAALTALVGFGGGTILIGVLLLFMPPAVAIPFHGLVQLFSNGWRVILFRKHIGWHLAWRFTLLLPLGIILGLWFFQGLGKEMIQLLIGLTVVFALFARNLKGVRHKDLPTSAFIPLGLVMGILNMIVGVVAPLMGVLVVRKELNKEAMIGTLGFFALSGHVFKVAAFGWAGFHFEDHIPALAIMVPSVMVGGVLGKWLLGKVDEKFFRVFFQGLLILLSLKLIIWEGLWPLLLQYMG